MSNEGEPTPGDLAAFEAVADRRREVDVLVHDMRADGGVPERLGPPAEAAGVPWPR